MDNSEQSQIINNLPNLVSYNVFTNLLNTSSTKILNENDKFILCKCKYDHKFKIHKYTLNNIIYVNNERCTECKFRQFETNEYIESNEIFYENDNIDEYLEYNKTENSVFKEIHEYYSEQVSGQYPNISDSDNDPEQDPNISDSDNDQEQDPNISDSDNDPEQDSYQDSDNDPEQDQNISDSDNDQIDIILLDVKLYNISLDQSQIIYRPNNLVELTHYIN
jgi:hypothetical protein